MKNTLTFLIHPTVERHSRMTKKTVSKRRTLFRTRIAKSFLSPGIGNNNANILNTIQQRQKPSFHQHNKEFAEKKISREIKV